MKINKKIYSALEQLYYTGLTDMRGDSEYSDVPIINDKEYKTNMSIPPVSEDFEEPELKTKKGKNILREPPSPNPEDNKIDNVELYDDSGEEIGIDWSDSDDGVVTEQDEKNEEDDDNGLGDIAQSNMSEQNPETGEDPNIDPSEETPDPNGMMGGDPIGTDPNVDPLTGEPKKTAEEVGKIFELKKIYSRLLAIESQLSFSSDIVLLKLRKIISQSLDLFKTLISNVDAYKNDIDDIIVMYYEFLEEVYGIMNKYYINKEKEDKKQIKKDTKNSYYASEDK